MGALLRVPYRMLYPAILIFCCIGVYSINNAPADVMMTASFGLVGYWLIKHDFEPAPMLLGFVLGPLMEENLRRAMLIARGDATVFFTRPISGTLLVLALILLVISVLPMIRKRREEVFVEIAGQSRRGNFVPQPRARIVVTSGSAFYHQQTTSIWEDS